MRQFRLRPKNSDVVARGYAYRNTYSKGKIINTLASDTTDLVSAWGAMLGGGATVIAASAGVAAAVVGIRTLKASKRDSQNRSRPMVGALLVLGKNPKDENAYLVIRNYGQSVAYNVEVRFEPTIIPSATRSGKPSFVPSLLKRYEAPIKTWMPGVETRNAWFFDRGAEDENGHSLNDEPIPDVVTAVIRYSDGPVFLGKAVNRYRDEFVLDVGNVRGELITIRSDDPHKLQYRTTKAIEDSVPAVEAIAGSLSRIAGATESSSAKAAKRSSDESDFAAVDEALRALGVEGSDS